MTDTDLFREVEEDLERQRLEALWKRYGGLVIAAALAIVIGTAGASYWHSWHTQKNRQASGELIKIFEQDAANPTKQVDALVALAQKYPATTQGTLAQLRAAADEAGQGHQGESLQIYDTVAKDTSADPAFRQFADLISVEEQMDDGDPAALQARLQPLAAANAPWRYTAKEYLGYLALRTGDKEKAKQIFTDLSQDASAPQSLSIRAADILHYLGG